MTCAQSGSHVQRGLPAGYTRISCSGCIIYIYTYIFKLKICLFAEESDSDHTPPSSFLFLLALGSTKGTVDSLSTQRHNFRALRLNMAQAFRFDLQYVGNKPCSHGSETQNRGRDVLPYKNKHASAQSQLKVIFPKRGRRCNSFMVSSPIGAGPSNYP